MGYLIFSLDMALWIIINYDIENRNFSYIILNRQKDMLKKFWNGEDSVHGKSLQGMGSYKDGM